MANAYNQFLGRIQNATSYNDLGRALTDAKDYDPFADDTLDDAALKRLASAAKRREKQLDSMFADAQALQRREGVRAMLDALETISVKGSGIGIKYGIRNGKRVPLSGGALTLPSSGSGEGDSAFDAGVSGLKDLFRDSGSGGFSEFAAPPRPGQEKLQRYSLDELIDKEGTVPNVVAHPAIVGLLKEAAGYGDLGTGDVDTLAGLVGLNKRDTSSVRGAVRQRQAQVKSQERQQSAEEKARAAEKAARQRERDAQKKLVSTITNAVMKKVPSRPPVTAEDIAKNLAAQKVISAGEVFGPPPPPPADGNGDGSGGDGDDGNTLAKRRAEQRRIEDKYAGYLRGRGREGEIGSHGYNEVLYGMFDRKDILTPEADKKINGQRDRIASGEAAAESRAEREQARENLRKVRQARQSQKQTATDTARDARQQEKERREAERWLASVDRDAKRQGEANRPYNRFMSQRRDIEGDLRDEYADGDRAHMIGGKRYQQDLAKRYADGGVGMDSDNPATKGHFDLYKGAMLVGSLLTSVRSGVQVGNAVATLAGGLNAAVMGAGGAFVSVGNAILGQILSPFGKAGEFASKIIGTLPKGLLSLLGAAGGIGQAGLKIGGSAIGGLVGGGGAMLGGLLGAGVGSVIPGAGTLVGAVAGSGVMAALGAAAASMITTVASAFGQALSAVGKAFGEVGQSVAEAIGSIKSVVSDLIESASKFAGATATLSRRGGFGEAAGSGVAALSRILTGSPDGMNSLFANFGHNASYVGAVASGFGVRGVTGQDPLSLISGAYGRYQSLGNGPMGNIQRNILLNGLFGGNADQVGNLFDSGMTGAVLKRAKASEQGGGDTKSALRLSIQMADVDAQIDTLRRKFLTQLLPPLTAGLNAFSTLLTQHGSQIVAGFEQIGQWFYVRFPSYLRAAIRSVFEFGKAFALQLPEIANFGKQMAESFITGYNIILPAMKGILAAVVGVGMAMAQTMEMLHLAPKGAGAAMAGVFKNVAMLPFLDPKMADAKFDALAKLGGKDGRIYQGLQSREQKFLSGYDSIVGTEAGRSQGYKHLMAAADKINRAADTMDKAAGKKMEIDVRPSDHFIVEVAGQTAEIHLRALQTSSG